MAKAKPLLLLVVCVALLAAGAVKISVEPAPKEAALTIRNLDEQIVLYTIYRGSYDKIGPAIGKLFALAGQKAIRPAAIYQKLYRWIAAQGYVVTDAASEIFLTNATTGDYAKMKTEILVPVEKLPEPEP